MTCFPLTPSQLPFNRLPDELGTAFAILQNRVDPVQRPLGESGRGALVVDLLPTHAHRIDDITNCYKPYFAVAIPGIDDIIFASERRQAMIVIWKKNGMRLRVLDVFEGKFGESRLMVCKETATDPMMGRFSVRTADTSAEDLMVIA